MSTQMNGQTLRRSLEKLLRGRGVADATIVELEPLTGGYSQLSYRFVVESSGGARPFVLRADRPAGSTLTRTDRRAEWELLRRLSDAGLPVPMARWVDLDGSELGTAAIVSDFVAAPTVLQAARSGRWRSDELALRMVEAAAAVHGMDVARLPSRMVRPVDWERYLDDQISIWREIERTHVERLPGIRYLAHWLDSHRPEPAGFTLVHGEFSLANVLVDQAGTTTVIDWEYGHVGDPRVDLGWCMSRAMMEPPNLIADNLELVCQHYCRLSGLPTSVVNPASVFYFSILSSAPAWRQILGGIARMAEGHNDLLLSAFLMSSWNARCAHWVRQIMEIESNEKGLGMLIPGKRC